MFDLSALCASNIKTLFEGFLTEDFNLVSKHQQIINAKTYNGVSCISKEAALYMEATQFTDAPEAGDCTSEKQNVPCTPLLGKEYSGTLIKKKACFTFGIDKITEQTSGMSRDAVNAYVLGLVATALSKDTPAKMVADAVTLLTRITPDNALHTVNGSEFDAASRTKLFRLPATKEAQSKAIIIDEDVVTDTLVDFVTNADCLCTLGALNFYDSTVSNKSLVETTLPELHNKALILVPGAVETRLVNDIVVHPELVEISGGMCLYVAVWVTYEIKIKNFNFTGNAGINPESVALNPDNWEATYDVTNKEDVKRWAPSALFKKGV